MDGDAFFRQATLRICGSLEIEEALQRLLILLQDLMPVDRFYLQYYDADYAAMRTIAYADAAECRKLDLLTPLSEEAKAKEAAVLKLMRQVAEPWFVYILRCGDGSLYTGIAKDVGRRLEQHNGGTASRYTRGRLPVRLEYQERQPNQSMALKRESAIKALSRKAKEALIRLPNVRDLQR